jgi:DNA repair protein SbcD/Mre11
MKIIHTADWHIGKMLYKQDLHDDHVLFFDWLITFIRENNVDILLVSGDIFDLANPSSRDLRLYYDVLRRITDIGTRVILTGGNHDGISMLNAPQTLLNMLNISVTGGVPDDFNEQIIPLGSDPKIPECVVLAVPFLRDKDLRLSVEASVQQSKSETIRNAIKNHYDRLVLEVRSRYGDEVPVIAMGHLFMSGSLTSDSERDIHIGNLEGMPSRLMSTDVNYWALGHIHKAQMVGGNSKMRYSGSPVYLDFSESNTEKIVILLEFDENRNIDIEKVQIPLFRSLLRFSGNLEYIRQKLESIETIGLLPSWIELDVNEENYQPALIESFERLNTEYKSGTYSIIKSRIYFSSGPASLPSMYMTGQTIEDLTPQEVFEKRLESDITDTTDKDLLREAYNELLEEVLGE